MFYPFRPTSIRVVFSPACPMQPMRHQVIPKQDHFVGVVFFIPSGAAISSILFYFDRAKFHFVSPTCSNRRTTRHYNTQYYAIPYYTMLCYIIRYNYVISYRSGSSYFTTLWAAYSQGHSLGQKLRPFSAHVPPCKGTPLLSPCATRHYTTLRDI